MTSQPCGTRSQIVTLGRRDAITVTTDLEFEERRRDAAHFPSLGELVIGGRVRRSQLPVSCADRVDQVSWSGSVSLEGN
jgi:hypothetical protein